MFDVSSAEKLQPAAIERDDLPPLWLRVSCFVIGCVIPAAVLLHLQMYFVFEASPPWLSGLLMQGILAISQAIVIYVGVSACFFYNRDAAGFVALASAGGGILLAVGVWFDYSITPGWTLNDGLTAIVATDYLFTSSLLHWRSAYLAARIRQKDVAG